MKKMLIAMAVAVASVSGIIAEETAGEKPAAAGGPKGPSANANERAKENAEKRRERKAAHRKEREERRAEHKANKEERRREHKGQHGK
ncbi:MAG TPA: hypothetical protein PKC74_07020 [Turneriella sp.]|nr:hypothetical protein [Turneriella sp.]HNA78628.1 hypothetical protein [Turneriella sp.]